MPLLLVPHTRPAPKRRLGPSLQFVLERAAPGEHIGVARLAPALTHDLERSEAHTLGQVGFAGPLRTDAVGAGLPTLHDLRGVGAQFALALELGWVVS